MKANAIIIGAFTLLLLAGCKNQSTTTSNQPATSQETTASAQAATSPEELGSLGAQIKAHPSEAKKILADRGMTEESFEKAIRNVSSDPTLSKRYAAAYKRSKS